MNNTDPQTPPSRPSRLATFWRQWLRPFVVIALLMFAFRSAVLDWNVVPTGSMKPTIVEGDYILVNKLAYDVRVPFAGWSVLPSGQPQRGEIVVFVPPGETERYVKRIVGVPGDVVEVRDNKLLVNGRAAGYALLPDALPVEAVDEGGRNVTGTETVVGRAHPVMLPSEWTPGSSFGPAAVPRGHYFVLGDNRGNSKDSRAFGFVGRDRILGRATRVVVSLDPSRSWGLRAGRFLQALA
jgi:signal peptidase I